jgi:hypothetical protein
LTYPVIFFGAIRVNPLYASCGDLNGRRAYFDVSKLTSRARIHAAPKLIR